MWRGAGRHGEGDSAGLGGLRDAQRATATPAQVVGGLDRLRGMKRAEHLSARRRGVDHFADPRRVVRSGVLKGMRGAVLGGDERDFRNLEQAPDCMRPAREEEHREES
jgi:hypothetical protein